MTRTGVGCPKQRKQDVCASNRDVGAWRQHRAAGSSSKCGPKMKGQRRNQRRPDQAPSDLKNVT